MNKMDPWKTSLLTIILGLTISMATTESGAVDHTNAQATSNGGSSGGDINESPKIVRRYVPQFIGKRENELSSAGSASSESTKDGDVNANENDDDFIDFLKQYENIANEYDSSNVDDSDETGYNTFDDDTDGYYEYEDKADGSAMDDGPEGEASYEEYSDASEKDKRYQPRFIGKRYHPTFVGKRYQPTFVGKRYAPTFVGKRYQPTFVGKRYQPRFIGKRLVPRFIGKRYIPKFVGKRYQPTFVGKRYQPTFVGKRYQPTFVGKRYQPMFVGKRYTPRFVGKRYQPRFVGKRDTADEEQTGAASLLDLSEQPVSLEKRSVDTVKTEAAGEIKSRHKRSLGFDDDFKRAWGRYVPWQDMPTIKVLRSESALDKRFVTPEFIGRRDSISSILSALKALKFARSSPRLEAKRFQAPLFVGKRGSDIESPSDLVWRYDLGSTMDGDRWEDLPLYQ